jgi:hypothetical protein
MIMGTVGPTGTARGHELRCTSGITGPSGHICGVDPGLRVDPGLGYTGSTPEPGSTPILGDMELVGQRGDMAAPGLASDYEAGLVSGTDYEGDRIVQLRLRSAVPEPAGFGALVQYFGALLSRAGAVDLARLRFEEVGDDVPATVPPLPDEPQALDFAAP